VNVLERSLSSLALVAAVTTIAAAAVPDASPLEPKAFRHPALRVPALERPVAELEALAPSLRSELAGLGAALDLGFLDWRADRWGTLVLSVPLLPGSGTGNDLDWGGPKPRDGAELQQRAWEAVRGYLQAHQEQLRVDLAQLPAARVGIFDAGNLIQVHAARVVRGIPVRESGVSAVLSHGNLVLLGLERWGDVDAPTAPVLAAGDARARVAEHLQPFRVASYREQEQLEIVALARGEDASTVVRGHGYDYRLAWVSKPDVPGDAGSWEALVDATSGELLAFEDKNQYAVRRVVGGVYPGANDQVPPDGVEQPGWPMPFTNVAGSGPTLFTSSGGIVPGCVDTQAQTTLAGQYVRILDVCGPINEASTNDIDLGVSGGTDCTVPPGHSAGDTHASRTSFYELNRIKEQGRGYLPGNAWLGAQLTINVNMIPDCLVFWNGSTLNFYRSSGPCKNTGENPSLLDHEWGHGLDNNGVNPNITSPQEAIADVYSILRQNATCVARGLLDIPCDGFGDECDTCTGLRELDWLQHRCDRPHDIDWILNGFTSAECNNTGPAPACPAGNGPCGREQHCESQVVGEVAWDLQFRDLRAAPFNYDSNTALELATRLMYVAPQLLTSWYTCGGGCAAAGTCGCGATSGYMLTLAVDDDDGNIANGTPHMTAIRAAFERHEIHCAMLPVSNSGCAGGPTSAPVVSAAAAPQGVSLSWTPVARADHYDVYRTEGVFACDYGKARVGQTAGTTFLDPDLLDGRPYSYVVLAAGTDSACTGPTSACATATPSVGQNPCGIDMAFAQAASSVPEAGGGVTVTVVLSTPDGLPSTAPASVDFATADGTASAGSDYASSSGTLSFPTGTPNGATQAIVVPILDDATDEADETFTVSLTNPQGGTVGSVALHTVSILDDDAPTSVSIADVTIVEGTGGTSTAFFGVTLAAQSGQVVTVDFATADGTATAPADYAAQSGTLSFAPGVTARTIDVSVVGDAVDEPDETFTVNLTNPGNVTIADGQAIGTLADDDAATGVSIADVSVVEGNTGTTSASFSVTLAAQSALPITVDYATADGTATAPGDYAPASGTLSFAPGSTAQAVGIAVTGDALDETDETFSVNLSNPTNTTISDGVGVGTIIDDDLAPFLAIADATIREGAAGTTTDSTFTLSLSAPSGQSVAVSYGTMDGTASAGTDYQAAAGVLSFPPGSVSGTVTVTVNGDDVREGDEAFLVNLTNPINTMISDGQAAGSIQDDDSWPELTHGQAIATSLRAQPGPAADADMYQLSQRPYASYEVVVDGLSGDTGASGPLLERLASDAATVIQGSDPTGAGSSRSLRWENATGGVVGDEYVRVRSGGCTTDCGPEDVYRIRLYDTTASLARFNNSASQVTVLALQNVSAETVAGNVRFWSAAGAPLASLPLSLAPHGTLVANTSTIAGLAGQSGSVTIGNDGVYGALAGKAVAVEPATGFTFDSPLALRPR
jgi:hypothetical protein